MPETLKYGIRKLTHPRMAGDQQLTGFRYVKKHGPSDPRDMRVMKHFAETMALGTIGKLDDEDELPTPDSLRCKMRRFYNAWERHHNLTISLDVKRSMAPVSVTYHAVKEALRRHHDANQ
jgi:hypothetical protein